MYLSRITINKSDCARLKIKDSYAWHQKLWEAFPEHDGEKRKFLFRVDDAGRQMCVLMLSPIQPVEPEWLHDSWETKEVAKSFLSHNVYAFKLRVNPTMRRNADRRRLAIYHEDKLHEWMTRKATQSGFAIKENSLLTGAPIDEYFVKNSKRGKHVSVEFQGILSVNDRQLFENTFEHGIGSAKAFGFGLLMLKPLK